MQQSSNVSDLNIDPQSMLDAIDRACTHEQEGDDDNDDPRQFHPRLWWERYWRLKPSQTGSRLKRASIAGLMEKGSQLRRREGSGLHPTPVYRWIGQTP